MIFPLLTKGRKKFSNNKKWCSNKSKGKILNNNKNNNFQVIMEVIRLTMVVIAVLIALMGAVSTKVKINLILQAIINNGIHGIVEANNKIKITVIIVGGTNSGAVLTIVAPKISRIINSRQSLSSNNGISGIIIIVIKIINNNNNKLTKTKMGLDGITNSNNKVLIY